MFEFESLICAGMRFQADQAALSHKRPVLPMPCHAHQVANYEYRCVQESKRSRADVSRDRWIQSLESRVLAVTTRDQVMMSRREAIGKLILGGPPQTL